MGELLWLIVEGCKKVKVEIYWKSWIYESKIREGACIYGTQTRKILKEEKGPMVDEES